MKPLLPRTLAISDRRLLVAGSSEGPAVDAAFGRWLTDLGAAGVEAVQIREKDVADRQVLDWARDAVARRGAASPEAGPPTVLVNGRLDLARVATADGVHLPAAEAPADRLRAALDSRNRCLIGRSTHTLAEVERAREEGVDYVTFGPVYDTPSKTAYGPAPGLPGLAAAAAVGLPVLALGGLSPERVDEVAATGAWGVAAIRAFHRPTTRQAMVAACRRVWGAPTEGRR